MVIVVAAFFIQDELPEIGEHADRVGNLEGENLRKPFGIQFVVEEQVVGILRVERIQDFAGDDGHRLEKGGIPGCVGPKEEDLLRREGVIESRVGRELIAFGSAGGGDIGPDLHNCLEVPHLDLRTDAEPDPLPATISSQAGGRVRLVPPELLVADAQVPRPGDAVHPLGHLLNMGDDSSLGLIPLLFPFGVFLLPIRLGLEPLLLADLAALVQDVLERRPGRRPSRQKYQRHEQHHRRGPHTQHNFLYLLFQCP